MAAPVALHRCQQVQIALHPGQTQAQAAARFCRGQQGIGGQKDVNAGMGRP